VQGSTKFWTESRRSGENYFDRSKVIAHIRTDDVEILEANLFQLQLMLTLLEEADSTGADSTVLVSDQSLAR
jgi:hypothetical protein